MVIVYPYIVRKVYTVIIGMKRAGVTYAAENLHREAHKGVLWILKSGTFGNDRNEEMSCIHSAEVCEVI